MTDKARNSASYTINLEKHSTSFLDLSKQKTLATKVDRRYASHIKTNTAEND